MFIVTWIIMDEKRNGYSTNMREADISFLQEEDLRTNNLEEMSSFPEIYFVGYIAGGVHEIYRMLNLVRTIKTSEQTSDALVTFDLILDSIVNV